MEDEVFEKYFENIEKIFSFFDYLYVTRYDCTEKNYTYTKEERKKKLRDILEEIYIKGARDVINKESQLYKKEAES